MVFRLDAWLIWGSLMLQYGEQSCIDNNVSKSSGITLYKQSNPANNYTWTYAPPDNRTDAVFVISVIYLMNYTQSQGHLWLPNGKFMEHQEIRLWRNKPVCYTFLYTTEENNTCLKGLAAQYCNGSEPSVANTWPPQISIRHYSAHPKQTHSNKLIRMYISFIFLSCSTLYNKGNRNDESSVGAVASVVLSLLLVVSGICFYILLKKYRLLKGQMADVSPNFPMQGNSNPIHEIEVQRNDGDRTDVGNDIHQVDNRTH